MQGTVQNWQTQKNTQLPARLSIAADKMKELILSPKYGFMATPPRSRPACTCGNRPGSARCARHGYVVPGDRLKKRQASQEILRRALAPPPRRLGHRGMNVRPGPSRLSNMSMSTP